MSKRTLISECTFTFRLLKGGYVKSVSGGIEGPMDGYVGFGVASREILAHHPCVLPWLAFDFVAIYNQEGKLNSAISTDLNIQGVITTPVDDKNADLFTDIQEENTTNIKEDEIVTKQKQDEEIVMDKNDLLGDDKDGLNESKDKVTSEKNGFEKLDSEEESKNEDQED